MVPLVLISSSPVEACRVALIPRDSGIVTLYLCFPFCPKDFFGKLQFFHSDRVLTLDCILGYDFETVMLTILRDRTGRVIFKTSSKQRNKKCSDTKE